MSPLSGSISKARSIHSLARSPSPSTARAFTAKDMALPFLRSRATAFSTRSRALGAGDQGPGQGVVRVELDRAVAETQDDLLPAWVAHVAGNQVLARH